MKTGFRGTFVISWSQTEVDGLEAAPVQSLSVGAAWSWRGDAIRVDGPSDILRLDRADGADNLRKRAARMVHRLVGAALDPQSKPLVMDEPQRDAPLMDSSFVVTDGAQSYTVTLIEVGRGSQPLLMFLDEMPPRNCDLWIVHHTLGAGPANVMGPESGGVICFTPGTFIQTPDGPRRIEELCVGDRVQTKDNGPQLIEWVGSRRMTGARLFAMPRLRPVRIRTGALGVDRPEHELLVSPEHRLLVKGAVAQSLFNTAEVLVTAKDLVNGTTITVDLKVPQVTYIHLLLPSHQVLWANGVETESFHPANAALSTLDDFDRARLLAEHPDLEFDPHTYGGYARRNLSASEAAILNHAA
ncbi:Hint domain-containing protein [Sulfitobacter sabulilitoris]|uniref:Hint domain-containing protein n=1 Tax=Sulfitobacter sabulilitoris TaxID=2562655 RepID=A0A5S3PDE7_9RHOB|nr:Hint domain-containing protein [Sulfitobacter sabulilitoris]TMM51893.1 Hint domain-containing protein [Sulfitobacter sabulilitoris]